MILAIRTDQPDAELGLWDDSKQIAHDTWHADRQLAETLTHHITSLLDNQGIQLQALTGIGVYSGPGSFTGLRIGISVANALGTGLKIPVYSLDDDSWGRPIVDQAEKQVVLPRYGSEPHITQPRK